MDTGLKDAKALVLASSGGLGLAIGQELLSEGASVMLSSRDSERLEAAAATMRTAAGSGDRVFAATADVSDPNSISRLFEYVRSTFGGLDILVCNAGGPPAGGFGAVDDETWEFGFRLSVMSVVRSVRAAIPLMRNRPAPSILVVGSSSVKRPIPNLLLSNVYRPAVRALVTDISADLASDGIRINMLCPGRMHTSRVDALDHARAEREGKSLDTIRSSAVSAIPLKRLGDPSEFARAAVFLLGTSGSYITGSTVMIDGGAVRVL